MPKGPDRRQDQTRGERAPLFLQPRQRKSTPARFFAEPDEQEDEKESVRHFAPIRGARQQTHPAKSGQDPNRRREQQNRQSKNDGIPFQGEPNADDATEQPA